MQKMHIILLIKFLHIKIFRFTYGLVQNPPPPKCTFLGFFGVFPKISEFWAPEVMWGGSGGWGS